MASKKTKSLTSTEGYIIKQTVKGDKADVSSRRDKNIRAQVLVKLVVGERQEYARQIDRVTKRGLYIKGAKIKGEFNISSWLGTQVSGERALPRISFDTCQFDSPVHMARCHIESLMFWDCDLISISGNHIVINSLLNLKGSKFDAAEYLKKKEKNAEHNHSLDLSNASIGGDLDMGAGYEKPFKADRLVSLDGIHIKGSFLAEGAQFFHDAAYSLQFDGALITGNVLLKNQEKSDQKHSKFLSENLYQFLAKGGVRFKGAKIGGSLDMSGARLTLDQNNAKNWNENPRKINVERWRYALNIERTTIKGDAIFLPTDTENYSCYGVMGLAQTEIGGNLLLSGACLSFPYGPALELDGAKIGGNLLLTPSGCSRFHACGGIQAEGLQAGGSIWANGVSLTAHPNNDAPDNADESFAFRCENSRIGGNIYIRQALEKYDPIFEYLSPDIQKECPRIVGAVSFRHAVIKGRWAVDNCIFDGKLDLRDAHIAVLAAQTKGGWPKAGKLKLSGLKYDAIQIEDASEYGDKSIAQRGVAWLGKQYKDEKKPSKNEFDPQPYHQLAAVLRTQGYSEEAEAITATMLGDRLSAKIDKFGRRCLNRFLEVSSNFGYSGFRSVFVMFLWFFVGSLFYFWQAGLGSFGPMDHVRLGHHQEIPNVEITLYHTQDIQIPILPKLLPKGNVRGCPGHVAPIYALDVMIPVIDLGQRRACSFDPNGPFSSLWKIFHAFYAVFGAILTAITIVTLTGLMRRE
jgi:hypothetical protein